MKSISFGNIDVNDFAEIYAYINHIIESGYNINKLIVSPSFYVKILKHPLWYNIRLAKHANQGFNYFQVIKMKNNKDVIKLMIVSTMDGNFCIVPK